MFYSTRSKLIASFLSVSVLVGAVSMLFGGRLLYNAFISETRNRVRLDLNAAREIYLNRIRGLDVSLNITTLGLGFRSACEKRSAPELVDRLRTVAKYAELDFAGVVMKDGTTLCRIGPDPIPKDKAQAINPVVRLTLERQAPVSGTVVLSRECLTAESPQLADQARIRLSPTPRAAPRTEEEETSGMALAAAVPVSMGGDLLGVLYGGVLLNQSRAIVDTVRDMVFQEETYKGRTLGTATIFLNDLRVSTNVLTSAGERAVGTRVSEEVKERVLLEGKMWTGRAYVVSDWYITAYEPIEDIFGRRVGMVCVGVLESKYADIRTEALSLFVLVSVAGMALAIGLGFVLTDKIMNPVHRLIKASHQVSDGNLSPEIGPMSKDEMGVLQNTFKEMIASLRERDTRSRIESENRLLQSEKEASIGRLAAGVAHEINNPLTGVLTYAHMLLRRKDIGDEIRSDLQIIVESTERVRRIVKDLLDFSRQTKPDKEPLEMNRLVRSTISLMENQALVKGVTVTFNPRQGLPMLALDRRQFQSVLLNVLLNALDASDPGSDIAVSAAIRPSADDAGHTGIEIAVADTGCGIPPENLDRLFDPFFTTKEVGKGTGLGLAVSSGIVHRHGGAITAQSEVGRGSRFAIWLPS